MENAKDKTKKGTKGRKKGEEGERTAKRQGNQQEKKKSNFQELTFGRHLERYSRWDHSIAPCNAAIGQRRPKRRREHEVTPKASHVQQQQQHCKRKASPILSKLHYSTVNEQKIKYLVELQVNCPQNGLGTPESPCATSLAQVAQINRQLPRLTPLELQSRLGEKALKALNFQVICPQLPPKRDCSPKRVNS